MDLPVWEAFEYLSSLAFKAESEHYHYWESNNKHKLSGRAGAPISDNHWAMKSVDNYLMFLRTQRGYDTNKTIQPYASHAHRLARKLR